MQTTQLKSCQSGELTLQSDDRLMSLVEEVLTRPKDERQEYLKEACGSNQDLFAEAWRYVEWDERMGDFLLDPLCPRPTEDITFSTGEILNRRFRIEHKAGSGGMATVWRAWDGRSAVDVALKFAKTGFAKQLSPELRNAREISHPNVCKIFDVHTLATPDGEADFISMEYVHGQTLSERLKRGALPKEECQDIALQLCAGLEEAHRHGVIHGDLKSNNVMLTTGPGAAVRAVIMDFGLAQKLSDEKTEITGAKIAGTVAYMAPELWKGVKPSVASDIYALGVVFWEMISGKTPGDLGVTSVTLEWNERPAWKPPSGYGRWNHIIECCLKVDPTRRFENAARVAEALGPSLARRWTLRAVAAIVPAIVCTAVVILIVLRPEQTVKLAILPFTSTGVNKDLTKNLSSEADKQIGRLGSDNHTSYSFLPRASVASIAAVTTVRASSAAGATHVLRAQFEQNGNSIHLHANVTYVPSGVDLGEWNADYKPEELGYVPKALAGVVTNALHLKPLTSTAVNRAARDDYGAGIAAVNRDSGVDFALECFERSVKADGDSALTHAGLAEATWFKYAVTEDESWLKRATLSAKDAEKRDPDAPEVHRIIGLLDYHAGRYESAIGNYQRAINLDPTNSDAYRRLGEAYRETDQFGKALDAFQKAVSHGPDNYRNLRDLGDLYYQIAQYEKAVEYFNKAIGLAPGEWRGHYSLGLAALNLGRFDLAEREFRTTLRLRQSGNALHELGVVMMYEWNDKLAIEYITQALKVEPEKHLFWLNLGIAYRRSLLLEKAKGAFERGLALSQREITKNPRDQRVRAHLAYLCAELNDPANAGSEIEQALQQSPNDADVRYMAAMTYEVLGRREDTLAVLRSSPPNVIADLNRWPDVADLRKSSRFTNLLGPGAEK